jgi:carbonic anhydrase/acetyltransferase-like protein (isoleucine patch superfamily)
MLWVIYILPMRQIFIGTIFHACHALYWHVRGRISTFPAGDFRDKENFLTLYALDGLQPSLPSGFSFIASNATVIGNVILDEDVGIWFGVVIRGDNEPIKIGKRSNIQDNCVMHTDPGFPLIIGEGCTIGHGAIIHGCIVGDNCLIGMGARILNGAKIGNNCLIGAGALITERAEIPDNSLALGAPAKVIRHIDKAGETMLAKAADGYVANARRYSIGLVAIGEKS